jgi:ammonia channel protein AmtB
MDERLKNEMLWAAGCFVGALALLCALTLAAGMSIPLYALVTGAVLMAIAIDGYRFYQENAQVDHDVRATGAWRPARLIPVRERSHRPDARNQGRRQTGH